jgi:DNA polymerase III alpha subunit
LTKKDDEGRKSESNVIIFLNNTQGYYDAIKIYSKSWLEGFYYYNRLDWKTLKELWTPNLSLAFPFFSSFIARNTMTMANIVPDYNFTNPIFFDEQHTELPFENLLRTNMQKLVGDKHTIIKSKSIYYNKYADIDAFMTFRCINERSTLQKPELEHFGSKTFCAEDYQFLCK